MTHQNFSEKAQILFCEASVARELEKYTPGLKFKDSL